MNALRSTTIAIALTLTTLAITGCDKTEVPEDKIQEIQPRQPGATTSRDPAPRAATTGSDLRAPGHAINPLLQSARIAPRPPAAPSDLVIITTPKP